MNLAEPRLGVRVIDGVKLALGLLVVVAGCSAPSKPTPQKTGPGIGPVVHTPGTPGLPGAPTPTTHKPYAVAEAPHAGGIVQIALTPDGTAAISADEFGGIRLWPSLDGKQEPRVIDLPQPKQLGIGRLPAGFMIVSLDEAGGLYVAKLDDTGRKLSHVTLAPDPAYEGFEVSELGLLAWRADQTIVLIDADGATKARLPTEARQRVVSIAVAGKKAITIVEKEDAKRVVRWLTLEPTLAWGAIVEMNDDPGQVIALSPDATYYAVGRHDERMGSVQIIDVAKKTVATSTQTGTTDIDLAFADDNVCAIGTLEGIAWLDAKAGRADATTKTSGSRISLTMAAGGGHAITGQNGELVIATPFTTKFLGYDLISPRYIEPAGNGQMLIGLSDTFSMLDSTLHETGATPKVAPPMNKLLTQLTWVDGDRWLGESVQPSKGVETRIYLFDTSTGEAKDLSFNLKEASILMYEPSTQLVTTSFGPKAEVARLDTKAKQLDRVASVAKQGSYEQVLLAPTAPKLANGVQMIQVTLRDKPSIKWLKDAHFTDKSSATVTIDGSYAGADRAGHVYMWRNTQDDKLVLEVYADGKAIATLPATGPVSLWPDADGKRVVEVSQNAVLLLDVATGKQLWATDLGSVTQAMWLADGSLAITSAGGIAKLDASTGAVTSARCGWRFGLSTAPHPATARVEPLCAQLDR